MSAVQHPLRFTADAENSDLMCFADDAENKVIKGKAQFQVLVKTKLVINI